jgi:outer membrane lipoprotein-sorting protein
MKYMISILAFLSLAAVSLPAIDADEVVSRMEDNRGYETARIEGRMVIEDRFGERTSTFVMWSRGTEEALVRFTSAQEAGQRVLRTEDEIYLYYPDAAELIRLQGSALRQSMLGSDVSYEDMTGNRGLLADYEAELLADEELRGTPCYVVSLEARNSDVAYPKQRLWIDKEDFVLRRAEQYALSGRLLKEMEVREIMRQGDFAFPSHLVISDALKKNSQTAFVIEEAELGIAVPRGTFSLEELSF